MNVYSILEKNFLTDSPIEGFLFKFNKTLKAEYIATHFFYFSSQIYNNKNKELNHFSMKVLKEYYTEDITLFSISCFKSLSCLKVLM